MDSAPLLAGWDVCRHGALTGRRARRASLLQRRLRQVPRQRAVQGLHRGQSGRQQAPRRGLHRGPAVRAGVRPRLQDLLVHGELPARLCATPAVFCKVVARAARRALPCLCVCSRCARACGARRTWASKRAAARSTCPGRTAPRAASGGGASAASASPATAWPFSPWTAAGGPGRGEPRAICQTLSFHALPTLSHVDLVCG